MGKEETPGLETKKDCTFSELVDWFLEHHVTKKKKSYKDDVRRAKLLKQHFGWRLARDIKPVMVESFQQKMLAMQNKRGQFYRPATVNRVLALMKRFYNLAVREELVDKNPCWRVPMLAENNARDRVLSWDELEKLLK